MANSNFTELSSILRKNEQDLLQEWVASQLSTSRTRSHEKQLRADSRTFLSALTAALERARAGEAITSDSFSAVREVLDGVSHARVAMGATPSEVARFILSLKQPLFGRLRQELGTDAARFSDEIWTASTLIDELALYTTEVYQRSRNEIIVRQQEEMLELSTPVVQLWEGVLAIPLIGTLDSGRTQVVMQNLLQAIVDTGAEIAIIDITGVPTVDTLVAQHLLKTVAAARLMGADCIISGIRPQIAQTIIHLGVDLAGVVTKATLAGAFRAALQRHGTSITQTAAIER